MYTKDYNQDAEKRLNCKRRGRSIISYFLLEYYEDTSANAYIQNKPQQTKSTPTLNHRDQIFADWRNAGEQGSFRPERGGYQPEFISAYLFRSFRTGQIQNLTPSYTNSNQDRRSAVWTQLIPKAEDELCLALTDSRG